MYLDILDRGDTASAKIIFAGRLLSQVPKDRREKILSGLKGYIERNDSTAYHDLVCIDSHGEWSDVGWNRKEAAIIVLLWEATATPPAKDRIGERGW